MNTILLIYITELIQVMLGIVLPIMGAICALYLYWKIMQQEADEDRKLATK